MTGKIWAARMVIHIWDQVQLGWNIHNDHVHVKSASIEDADLRRRTIAKIYHLHRLRRKVLQDHVEHLFLTDVCTTIRTSTLKFLRNWIRTYEPSIHESIAWHNPAPSNTLTASLHTSVHFLENDPQTTFRPTH
jgi:hypothetical protein